jgi:transmembrane 9 superfamily protein 3
MPGAPHTHTHPTHNLLLSPLPGGYASGGFYARNEGGQWILTMLYTATLFPLTCFGIAAVLNTIAILYQSLAAVRLLVGGWG